MRSIAGPARVSGDKILPLFQRYERLWRRLMLEIRAQLDDPARPAGEVLTASIAARKARLPFPPYAYENPFAVLVGEAERFAYMTPLEQRLGRDRLAADFDRCLAAWPDILAGARPPRPTPSWRKRKDCGSDD